MDLPVASTISAALDPGKFVCLSIDGYKILDLIIYIQSNHCEMHYVLWSY